jgi:hypothetical protein
MKMPRADFGAKTNFDGRPQFLELKSKGQAVTVKFLDSPVYDGKHFFQGEDGKWVVTFCPRIMNETECSYCNKYFEARKAIKALKDSEDPKDKSEVKRLENVSRKYNVAISFYYPVFDLSARKPDMFKTGLSIRSYLDNEYGAGIDILKYDYKITRLKDNINDPGKDWYASVRLPEVTELTKEEQMASEEFLKQDLESLVYGTKLSSQEMTPEKEEGIEEIDFDPEINFDDLTDGLDGKAPDLDES